MRRPWIRFFRVGLRGLIERLLFLAACAAFFLWYFQEKETYRFWRDRCVAWNEEFWGIDTRFSHEYGPSDATGDWVAFAIGQRLLTGFSDPELRGYDFTRGSLNDDQLRAIASPLSDELPASNTPLVFRYCISPAARGTRQEQPGWLSFKADGGFVNLLFGFPNPLNLARMPRLVVVAQPAYVFDKTPVRLFWRGPDPKQLVTERLRSMSAYFRTQGDMAIADLPLGRLVEWSKFPVAGLIRMDLSPKGSAGRIRAIAIGTGR